MLNYRPNRRTRLGRRLKRLIDEAETGLSRPNSLQTIMIMIMTILTIIIMLVVKTVWW
jgi:hypothetical protein